jgi:ribose 1,5-bisphosphokinase PhnN
MGEKDRAAILQVLEEHHQGKGRHGEMMDDADIAQRVERSAAQVQDDLEILENSGQVRLAKGFEGMSALITPRGRAAIGK